MANNQQKALYLHESGTLEVSTKPVPSEIPYDHLLVKLHATGLSNLSWKLQFHKETGLDLRMFDATFPTVLGTDGAGEVVWVGSNVRGFEVGDRVLFQGNLQKEMATYQQYSVIPAQVSAKIPDNVTYDEAATVPANFVAACTGLYSARDAVDAPHFKPFWEKGGRECGKGKAIVILGGASCVGQYAIQAARLSGFSLIITTSSSTNFELLKSLGATHTFSRLTPPAQLHSTITSILRGEDVPRLDIVFDTISNEETQKLGWELVDEGGVLVIVYFPVVNKAEHPTKHLQFISSRAHHAKLQELGRALFGNVTELLQNGSLKPNKLEVVPGGLSGIPEGLLLLKEGKISAMKLVARPHETP